MEFKYSVELFWSDEDDCFIAKVPEFPGLSAFGDSIEEAIAEAKNAAAGFIEVLKEDGDEIPPPRKLKQYSGQVRIRIPATLHENLAREAAREGMSLNSYILYLLSERHIQAASYQSSLELICKTMERLEGYSGTSFSSNSNQPEYENSSKLCPANVTIQ